MKSKWIVVITVISLLATACNNVHKNKFSSKAKDTLLQQKATTLYTCPMHHQIREDKPGKCPICGMTLVPVKQKQQKKADIAQLITLSAQQQFLGNIHTDTAKLASLSNQVILTGTTTFNPRSEDAISAWVSGWIEKMYVRNPGEKVKAGQKLYELYSPDLLSVEKDYLEALKQKYLFKKASVDLTATIRAIKQKLLRYGLSDSQIDHLPDQKLTGRVTIYSKTSGYLIKKMTEEGGYVKEGETVMKLANNNTLWVQAQLYDSELPLLENQHEIKVGLKAFPGKELPGKIVFNNPVNNQNSRVHLLNIAIPNPNGRIQPGMLAYVYLKTSKEQPAVVIPKSAVIYGEKNNYVWIERPDSSFERRKVQLGVYNDTGIQVLNGIKAGEIVVSSGAYLVNSEYVLQYGSGANMAGMTMSDMKMSGKGE